MLIHFPIGINTLFTGFVTNRNEFVLRGIEVIVGQCCETTTACEFPLSVCTRNVSHET